MNYSLGQFSTGDTLTLSTDDRRRHLYIIGKSGTGKSTLLQNLMRSDLYGGRGFALLDPHGDLASGITDMIPKDRLTDVLYVDASDSDHYFAFNPLQNVVLKQRPLVAAHIVSSFKNLWGESWGPRMEYILTASLRLLLDNSNTTLLGLPKLLVSDSYRTRLLKNCTDPAVRTFWNDEFSGWDKRFRSEAIAPIQNKVGALLMPPVVRNILGQNKSTIDIPSIMNEGKILILNLSKGKIGEAPAHLLGALFATAFAQAAEARAAIPEEDRTDFTLYVDEFQHFATDSFANILSEARKYRLSLCLSHQFITQISDTLRSAVLGNAGTLVAFRIGAEDAKVIAPELDIPNPVVLSDTSNFHAWVTYTRNGIPSNARLISTLPPWSGETGSLTKVIARSRSRYTRPRQQVEQAIEKFFSEPKREAKRPKW